MSISVLIEPNGTGFRASMNSPVALTADGATEDAALTAIRTAYFNRLSSGAKVVEFNDSWVDRATRAAERVGLNPLFPDYLQAIEEYRREANAIPEVS